MVIVDTNILTYLLIHGDRTKTAQALFKRDSDWRSETFIMVEFTNVLATYLRMGELTQPQSVRLLRDAERIVERGLSTVSHSQALATALQYGVSAYDARFLALSRTLGAPLITEDARLRSAAPELTLSLSDAVS